MHDQRAKGRDLHSDRRRQADPAQRIGNRERRSAAFSRTDPVNEPAADGCRACVLQASHGLLQIDLYAAAKPHQLLVTEGGLDELEPGQCRELNSRPLVQLVVPQALRQTEFADCGPDLIRPLCTHGE